MHRYTPPFWLRNGLTMTLHGAWWSGSKWLNQTTDHQTYDSVIIPGFAGIPLHAWLATPKSDRITTSSAASSTVRGTIIATYGITGTLEDQWYLRLFAQHALARGYAVLLIDWRGHGLSAKYSPVFTSDGIHEGRDFLCAADWLKRHHYPAPFFFFGYSFGGQLALWGAKYASEWIKALRLVHSLPQIRHEWTSWQNWSAQQDAHCTLLSVHSDQQRVESDLRLEDLGGVTTLAPTLHSPRSIRYLNRHTLGRWVDRCVTSSIHHLVRNIHHYHPDAVDLSRLERVRTMQDYDREYVIESLGFATVDDYLETCAPLHFLPELTLPTQIIYAADDPMFDPSITNDLQSVCNPMIDLTVTSFGGHIAHRCNRRCQRDHADPDPWWAMHRALDWIDRQVLERQYAPILGLTSVTPDNGQAIALHHP